jgi:Patatin phospholipase
MIQSLLDQIPGAQLKDDEERTIQRKLATTLREVTILSLIYQQTAYAGQAKEDEFSGTSMREHWAARRDTRRSLVVRSRQKHPCGRENRPTEKSARGYNLAALSVGLYPLAHKEWLKMPSPTGGVTIHDVHHSE